MKKLIELVVVCAATFVFAHAFLAACGPVEGSPDTELDMAGAPDTANNPDMPDTANQPDMGPRTDLNNIVADMPEGGFSGTDELNDWEPNCGPEPGIEGPPELDIVGASIKPADGGGVVVTVTYNGDAETDHSNDIGMGVTLQLADGRYIGAHLTYEGGATIGSADGDEMVSHRWPTPDTLEFTFTGVELANVSRVTAGTFSSNADGYFCDLLTFDR